MAEPLFVITGSTGHVGSVITQSLLEQRKRVRVIGRSAEHLKPFIERGAEPAIGSLENAEFVRRAVDGAKALFAMLPPNLQVDDYTGFQERVAENEARAAEASGVSHVVTLSSLGADQAEGTGPVVGLRRLERGFDQISAINALHLRAAYFFENHLFLAAMVKRVGVLGGALRPDLPFPQIATRDVGVVASRRLASLDFQGKSVLDVLGPGEVSMNEVARALGEAIGRKDLAYNQIPYEEAQRAMASTGLPEKTAASFTELTRAINEGRVKPTQPASRIVRTTTTHQDFAKIFAQAYRKA